MCCDLKLLYCAVLCHSKHCVCGRAGKQQRNSDLHSRKITHGLPSKTAAFVAHPETTPPRPPRPPPPPPPPRYRHDAESHVEKEGRFLSVEAPRFGKLELHRSSYLFRRPSRIICPDEERDKTSKSHLKVLIRCRQWGFPHASVV